MKPLVINTGDGREYSVETVIALPNNVDPDKLYEMFAAETGITPPPYGHGKDKWDEYYQLKVRWCDKNNLDSDLHLGLIFIHWLAMKDYHPYGQWHEFYFSE